MKEIKLTLKVSPELCTGCRACELACSFHQKKKFSRKAASVHVRRNARTQKNMGKPFQIMIYEDRTDGHMACDMCITERFPLCVRFCSAKALTLHEARA